MLKHIILIFSLIQASGCSFLPPNEIKHPELSVKNALVSEGYKFGKVEYGRFLYQTGGDQAIITTSVFFGGVGAVVGALIANSLAQSRGEEFIATVDYEPTVKAFASNLQEKINTQQSLKHEVKSPFSLDVKINFWSIRRGKVTLNSELYLYENEDKEVAKYSCWYRTDDTADYTNRALIENHGQLFLEELKVATDYCADFFVSNTFADYRKPQPANER